MLRLIDRLRFRFAFGDARRDLLKNLVLIAGLILAFGIVGRMDYEDALIAQAEAAEARFAEQQAAMLACLNGGSPGFYTVTREGHRAYLVCGEPYEVTDKNVGPT